MTCMSIWGLEKDESCLSFWGRARETTNKQSAAPAASAIKYGADDYRSLSCGEKDSGPWYCCDAAVTAIIQILWETNQSHVGLGG